jgi:3'-phosphoadenosine 5'-phosphosulfate sulfotransferase (PAPS reductase)/FAD synthetase
MNEESKETLLVSFSGGRTSAMMTKYILENLKDTYKMVVVFTNTGHERQATLDFVNECDKRFGFNTIWIEPLITRGGTKCKIVNYETAYTNLKKNGIDPFEAMIAKYGIPNVANPQCTRELKQRAIRAYMRDFAGHKRLNYKTAIGIRSDEPRRLNWGKAKKNKWIYFAQLGKVTKYDVNEFWSKQGFDLKLKSYEGNCILCWKKSDRKIFTLIQEGILANDPELLAEIEWLKMIEDKYGNFIKESRKDKATWSSSTMFREDRSINDMIEESHIIDTSDFAKDESNIILTAKQISMWDNSLDMSGGCTESCEVF